MKNRADRSHGWRLAPPTAIVETPVATVSKGPVLCHRSDRQKEFYLFSFPDWVNVVAITPAAEILLIRQYRYGSDRLELEIPGGTIDTGEDPLAAGVRELREETGFAGTAARVIGCTRPNPAIQDNRCYTILVESARQVAPPEQDDMEEIDWFLRPVGELLEQLGSGEIEHALVLNALLFYQRWCRTKSAIAP